MVIILKLNQHANATLQLALIVGGKDTGPATVLMTTGVIVVIGVVSAVTYRLGVVIPHAVLIHQVVVVVEALRPHALDLVLVIGLVADDVLVRQDLAHDPVLVVVEVEVVHTSVLLVLALVLVRILVVLPVQILVELTVVEVSPRPKHLVLDQLHQPDQVNPRVVRVVRVVAKLVRVVKVKEVVPPAVVLKLKVAILRVKIIVQKVTVVMAIVIKVKM